jgi:SWI/SNF-related matrix-associated actin-dependent regulator of chromatin subfamily A3
LCDEIGMGKTVTCVALILSHPRDESIPGKQVSDADWELVSEEFRSTKYKYQYKYQRWASDGPPAKTDSWYLPPADCTCDYIKMPEYDKHGEEVDERTGCINEVKVKRANEEYAEYEEWSSTAAIGRLLAMDKVEIKATLIIAPVALLGQWADEIRKYAPGLRVVLAHLNGKDAKAIKAGTMDLREPDVILCTARTQLPPYMHAWIRFHRVILDEAHESAAIVNEKQKHIVAHSRHRWAVTGTPCTTGVKTIDQQAMFLVPEMNLSGLSGRDGGEDEYGNRYSDEEDESEDEYGNRYSDSDNDDCERDEWGNRLYSGTRSEDEDSRFVRKVRPGHGEVLWGDGGGGYCRSSVGYHPAYVLDNGRGAAKKRSKYAEKQTLSGLINRALAERTYERAERYTDLVLVLRDVMIRHTKAQRIAGAEALVLPTLKAETVWITMSVEERAAYALEVQTEERAGGAGSATKEVQEASPKCCPREARCGVACGSRYCEPCNQGARRRQLEAWQYRARAVDQLEKELKGRRQVCANDFSCLANRCARLGVHAATAEHFENIAVLRSLYFNVPEVPTGFSRVAQARRCTSWAKAVLEEDNSRTENMTKVNALLTDLNALRSSEPHVCAVVFTQFAQAHEQICTRLEDEGYTVYRFSSRIGAATQHSLIRDFQQQGGDLPQFSAASAVVDKNATRNPYSRRASRACVSRKPVNYVVDTPSEEDDDSDDSDNGAGESNASAGQDQVAWEDLPDETAEGGSSASSEYTNASTSTAGRGRGEAEAVQPCKRRRLARGEGKGGEKGGRNKAKVMVITFKAGACGITLTAATRVYLFEPCLDPGHEVQAAGRIHRMGQTSEVFVKRLCFKQTVEERIVALHAEIDSGRVQIVDGIVPAPAVRRLACEDV